MARQVIGKTLPEDVPKSTIQDWSKEITGQFNLKRGVNLKPNTPKFTEDEKQKLNIRPNIPNLTSGEQEGVRAELIGDDRISPNMLSPVDMFTGMKNNPEDTKNLLKNVPGDPVIKRQVANVINKSPEEAAEAVTRAEADKAAGKPVGDVDNFLSALTYFLPTALSGVLGAAIGGSEAGVAAAQATQGLQSGYLDYLDKRTNTQLKAAETISKLSGDMDDTKIDTTPSYLDTRTDTLVTARTRKGKLEFINANNQIIPQEFVKPVSMVTAERDRNAYDVRQDRLDQRQIKAQEFQDREANEKRVLSDIESFSKDKLVLKEADAYTSMDDFESLLNSGAPLTSDFVATFIAKGLQGNVGAMAEGDIKRAKVPMDLGRKVISDFKQGLVGDMSDAEKKALAKIVNAMKEKKKENLLSRASNRAKDAALRLGVSAEGLENSYLSRLIPMDDSTSKKSNKSRLGR